YPLALVSAAGDRLHLRLEYDGRLFDAETVERMAGHLEVLLGAMAAGPEVPVRELPLLTQREREQLRGWNRTEREHDRRSVHEQVEEQARRRPEAVALVSGERALTYGELNGR